MNPGLYGRRIPGSLDAVNGGCIPLLLLEGRATYRASRQYIERLEEGGEAGRGHVGRVYRELAGGSTGTGVRCAGAGRCH